MISNFLNTEQRYGIGIRGVGYYVPSNVVTNEDMCNRVDTSDEWITTRIGVKERRWVDDDELLSDMAVKAGKKAIANAGLDVSDIDLIILGRVAPDHIDPATSCLVQHKLGAINAAAFDVVIGGCPGSVYDLAIGANFISNGSAKNVLVITGEILTRTLVDMEDRATCCFFGDGAGAVVLSRVEKGKGIKSYLLGVDGSRYDAILIEGGGLDVPITEENVNDRDIKYFRMKGKQVFDFATTVVPESIRQVVKEVGLKVCDIDFAILHQANINIIHKSLEALDFDMSKTHTTIEKYGNTSGASVLITLAEAVELKKIKPGDNVVLASFGAGLAWGSLLIEWNSSLDFD